MPAKIINGKEIAKKELGKIKKYVTQLTKEVNEYKTMGYNYGTLVQMHETLQKKLKESYICTCIELVAECTLKIYVCKNGCS